MDGVPWHLQRSYLKSDWHRSTFSPVLPNVRQQLEGRARPEADKALRPRSAGTRRDLALDPSVRRVCRLLPLPRIQDISGSSTEEQGVFQEAVLVSDSKLTEVLSKQDHHDIVADSIQRLWLSDLPWLSAGALAPMAGNFKELRELSLRRTRTDDASVAAIIAGCGKLERLDISCCMLTDISCVAQLADLRELRASRCPAVTEEFVGSLRQLRRLEVVDLSYSAGVSDQALVQMAAGCMRLKRLALVCCPRIGDAGLLAMTQANPGIGHLLLALNPDQFSDDMTSQAMVNLKRLRVLDLTNCPQLSRQLPFAIAKQCEYLEDLSLASCPMLRDDHVRRILLSCQRLQRLDLSGCKILSVTVFLEVVPHAHSLRRLNLSHIPAITDQAVAAIYRASMAGDSGFDAAAIAANLRAAAAAEEAEEEDDEEGSEARHPGAAQQIWCI
ncbi:Fbxl2 [Symbiodinium natans]|uniref:Fbxl2 protein n=1 Tax=Symbiodinium natans TaxID=878477 RepID=A0A812TNG7_9DINO|nr:Fbxl2 [Symbiodinium natans]